MGRKIHGESGTRIHNIWNSMMYRCCENSRHKEYKDYGGKGIDVCEDWQKYLIFKDWALCNGYAENLTLERIDNNGNYEPENCTWIPKKEQALNRDNTLYVSIVIPLICACRIYKLLYGSTRLKLKKGQDINKIIKYRSIKNYERKRSSSSRSK